MTWQYQVSLILALHSLFILESGLQCNYSADRERFNVMFFSLSFKANPTNNSQEREEFITKTCPCIIIRQGSGVYYFHFVTTYLSCIGGCWLIRLLGYSECFGINSSWLLSLPFKSKTVSRLENNVSAGEPCCTLNILSSKLSGSSLGCFFSFAPGCLEWCFSPKVTVPAEVIIMIIYNHSYCTNSTRFSTAP